MCVCVCACLSEEWCMCVYVCVGVHRFMGPPVKWNWERHFFFFGFCSTNPSVSFKRRLPGDLCLSFFNLPSFPPLSVFVRSSEIELVSLSSSRREEWYKIYSSNQMWWQRERVWSWEAVRKKEGRKFGLDLCARVCAGVCFSANVGIQFLCFLC